MEYKENVFTQIIESVIPATIIKENDKFMCFKDHNPQVPVHLLVIPKGKYTDFSHFMTRAEEKYEFFAFAMSVIEQERLDAYKLIMNTGEAAGQCVPHFHMHILSGMNQDK